MPIPFGLNNSRLVSVEEVGRGLACGCVCPSCYRPLVARKGARHAHHFAHYKGADCPNALETSLHLKAKEIFERHKCIAVPEVHIGRMQEPHWPARLLHFSRVYLENYLDGLIPDIVLESGKRKLLVEIAVTHFADSSKLRKICRLGHSAIEIDAGAIHAACAGQPANDCFREALIHGLRHKRWLFHAPKNVLEARLRRVSAIKKIRYRPLARYHPFTVSPCPAGVRRLKNQETTYADVWQDCFRCPYCLEIGYRMERTGFREVPATPESVCCWGGWDGDLDKLL